MSTSSTAALIRQLVDINSANPATSSEGEGESSIAFFCAHWLEKHGLRARIVETPLGLDRPAMVASSSGIHPGPTLLLCGHLDTYAWYQPPTGHDDVRIFGPGACDMKGGIAAILSVLASRAARPHKGIVTAVLVPDEEHASVGLRSLTSSIVADAAIVVEDTGLNLGLQQDGRIRATIHVPEARRFELLLALYALTRRKEAHLTGLTFATPGPAHIVVQRCVSPGEDADALGASLERDLTPLTGPAVHWDIRESLLTEADHPIAVTLARHAAAHGVPSRPRHVGGWTEAALLAAKGVPSIVFGPGGGGAHTQNEWVDVEQVEQAIRVLHDAALDFTSGDKSKRRLSRDLSDVSIATYGEGWWS